MISKIWILSFLAIHSLSIGNAYRLPGRATFQTKMKATTTPPSTASTASTTSPSSPSTASIAASSSSMFDTTPSFTSTFSPRFNDDFQSLKYKPVKRQDQSQPALFI